MMYKTDALEQLRLLYESNDPRQRHLAYNKLYVLINLLLPNKSEEDIK